MSSARIARVVARHGKKPGEGKMRERSRHVSRRRKEPVKGRREGGEVKAR